jgi:hypothetical protein
MSSNIYQSKFSHLIKIRGFWSVFYNSELCTYAGFSMVVLQQTWFLEVLVVFPNLKTKELASSLLILRET